MFDYLLADAGPIVAEWYRWGVAVAFAITAVITLWVFWDSQSKNLSATRWRGLSLLAALVVVPSFVLSWNPDLLRNLQTLAIVLAYAGIFATIGALVVLLLYSMRMGVVELEPDAEELDIDPLPVIEEGDTPTPLVGKRASVTPPPTPSLLDSETDESLPAFSEGQYEEADETPEALEPLAWLVMTDGLHAGKEYRLRDITDIGRDSKQNDIGISDPAISRQHARIRLEGRQYILYDLASANGLLVNGEAVQRHVIRQGDQIVMGQSQFGFMRVNEGDELPSVPETNDIDSPDFDL